MWKETDQTCRQTKHPSKRDDYEIGPDSETLVI